MWWMVSLKGWIRWWMRWHRLLLWVLRGRSMRCMRELAAFVMVRWRVRTTMSIRRLIVPIV